MAYKQQTDNHQTSYAKGLWAERFAAVYLNLNGYKVLERRYKTKYGEIDIIAVQDGLLVFVEVKSRKSIEEALESITPTSQRRIVNAARYFLSENHSYADYVMRFDVIAVESPMKIVHVDNAFDVGP